MAERADRRGEERRQAPRFEAAELGTISVRLIGGGDVQLINFSERGLLFQAETRLLVGARATVRIVRGNETVTAAGTVVRSLVQGMIGGKLQFRTALSLNQPLPLVQGLRPDRRSAETLFDGEAAVAEVPQDVAPAGTPEQRSGQLPPSAESEEAASSPALTPISVLFVSTTEARTARLRERLAGQPAVTLETCVQATVEPLARAAAERDAILFDSALGPDALGRLVTALRATPIGAALVLLVDGGALPAHIAALANGVVVDGQSGEALASALRDAAWTPWQPVAARPAEDTSRDDLYLRVFDALPVPVIVVSQAGRITVANIAASRRLTAPGEEMMVGRTLASLLAADAAAPLAALLEATFDGRQGQPLATTLAADGLPVALRPISLVPGADEAPELAIRCETRRRPVAAPRRPVEAPPSPPEASAECRARIAALEADLSALRATAAALERDRAAAAEWRRVARAEREAAVARARELIAERDEAVAGLEAERARAQAAVATLSALEAKHNEAVADAGARRRGRTLLTDAEPSLPAARLQRMVDDLRAELRTERELRKELEQQLDENAEALERTIQSYESKLEAAERRAAAPASQPRKTA